jgi:hypothetical protein
MIKTRDPANQITKKGMGIATPLEDTLMNAMIPVTTTIMVSVNGIRSESFIGA